MPVVRRTTQVGFSILGISCSRDSIVLDLSQIFMLMSSLFRQRSEDCDGEGNWVRTIIGSYLVAL